MTKKHTKRWAEVLYLSVIVLVVSISLAFGIILGAKDVLGLKDRDIQREVSIPKGASTREISHILKKNEIIDYPILFKLYSKLKKTDGTYRDGKYSLSSKMSYEDIIHVFQTMTAREDVVDVTIPEGFTICQIAQLMKEKKVCQSKQSFLDAVDKKVFDSKALSQVEEDEMIRFKLEGYLFPDTYSFILDSKPEYVINTLLQNFDEKIMGKYKKEFDNSDMSFSEIITLASIVQKESTTFDIMKKVASVFFNRLNKPSEYARLQSDVTILYVETDIKPNLEMKNQDMYDSYNTYVCKGLPVGPICCPGEDAIKAVLHPEETDYNYFLTDENNEYYWAKTLKEHNQNMYQASRVGNVRGLDTD